MTANDRRSKRKADDTFAYDAVLSDPPDTTVPEQDEDDLGKPDRKPLRKRPDTAETGSGRLGLIEQGTRIAASIGVAGAAIIGVIEYIQANDDTRRKQSLEVVRDWQGARHIDRYTRVQAFVEDRIETATIPPPDLPPPVLAHAYQTLGYNWMVDLRAAEGDDSPIEDDIDRLTLFFAQMEICISADLCNAQVLRAYFESEVTSFWRYFKGYAQLRAEENYEGYGSQVDALVARFAQLDAE